MKIYVYCLRDKKLGSYEAPQFSREDPEHTTEMMARSVTKIEDPRQKAEANDKALYYLGTFDDIKGKFDLLTDSEKLLDLEDYIVKKEVSHE